MKFEDQQEQANFEFMLKNVFHFESADEDYNEYWWRSCILHDGDRPGTQGYMVVWYDSDTGQFNELHTYRNPENLWGTRFQRRQLTQT